jgi:hypothetical protein
MWLELQRLHGNFFRHSGHEVYVYIQFSKPDRANIQFFFIV